MVRREEMIRKILVEIAILAVELVLALTKKKK